MKAITAAMSRSLMGSTGAAALGARAKEVHPWAAILPTAFSAEGWAGLASRFSGSAQGRGSGHRSEAARTHGPAVAVASPRGRGG